jgi:DNA-binding XRE family transcriptional regulator
MRAVLTFILITFAARYLYACRVYPLWIYVKMPKASSKPKQDGSTRVADLRKQLGLLQADFGQLFGVRQSSVSRWENGQKEPSVENYVRMANLADEESCLWFLERAGVDTGRLWQIMTSQKAFRSFKRS